MSSSLMQVGLLSAGVIFLFGAAILTIIAARIASSGRAAKAEADIRLAASQELAAEVKRLAEKVEASIQYRDASLENAFMRHNDACAASMHQQMATRQPGGQLAGQMSGKGGHHDDDDDDHHKKHHAAMSGKGGHHDDDDDDHHKKQHAAGRSSMSGHGHDDDDDDHKKHHAANDEQPSLLARLFGRVRQAQ